MKGGGKPARPGKTGSVRLEAEITALNEYGEGTFRGKGETVKIGRTYPGDRVTASFEPSGKPFVFGRLERLLSPSKLRCPAGCEAFDQGCGGCSWLNLDYQAQLDWKRRILGDVLQRRGGADVQVQPTLGMEKPLAYRNKMSLVNAGGRLAFLKDHSEDPVFPQVCKVESPDTAAVWDLIKNRQFPPEILQVHLRSGEGVGICFFIKRMTSAVEHLARELGSLPGVCGVGAASYRSYTPLNGRDWVQEKVGGFTYRIPLNGFFQTNTAQAGVLLDLVLSKLGDCKNNSALDLYCGCGFFTLPASKRFRQVLGIENNRDSIAAAEENARINRCDAARFECADVAHALGSLRSRDWQAVILDPPRSGCEDAVLHQLKRIAPRRIVYVSCSPESLGRDIRFLSTQYRVSFAQAVDMFPHTFHMETVAVLEARNP